MQKIFYYILFTSFALSLNTINCDICREKIETKYLIDSWGNKFHAYHEKDTNYCNTCSRLISIRITGGGFKFNDGRHMCKLCSSSMVNSKDKKEESLKSVLSKFTNTSIKLPYDGISISLVDRETLQNSIMHIPSHNKETVKAITKINNNQYVIEILWGLNKIEFESVLAHELLHVWIDYNNIRLNEVKLEGFCNLGSAMIYKHYNNQLSNILLQSMEENNDPIYGRGYKYMNSLLEIHGWSSLISIIKKNNED